MVISQCVIRSPYAFSGLKLLNYFMLEFYVSVQNKKSAEFYFGPCAGEIEYSPNLCCV